MNKREALEITRELWSWIFERAREEEVVLKSDWPGWKKHGKMSYWCPCCEYDEDMDNDCARCPLSSLWRETASIEAVELSDNSDVAVNCEMRGTPYRLWEIAISMLIDAAIAPTLAGVAAKAIVDACDKALEVLDGKS